MQKSYIQAAVSIIIALILAYGVKTAYISAMGADPETELLDAVGDLMVEAQDVFGNNVEKFIDLEDEIEGHDGLVLIRSGSGGVCRLENGEFVPCETDGLIEGLTWLFEGTEAVNSDTEETKTLYLWSVTITDERMILYTGFTDGGCAGIVFDRTGKGVDGLDTIQLYGDWYEFSIMDEVGIWG